MSSIKKSLVIAITFPLVVVVTTSLVQASIEHNIHLTGLFGIVDSWVIFFTSNVLFEKTK